MKIKENRGGARKGAGRPKFKEDTVVIRVPKSLVEIVKALIDSYESNPIQRGMVYNTKGKELFKSP